MPTPHIDADKDKIANIVLMPGDPLRAQFIANTYLQDVVQFNATRNMLGFTGTYHGKLISVMGSGMGMPSIGIYSYELFKFYGVDCIIRLGSAGAYTDRIDVHDVVLVTSAYSESNFAKVQNNDDHSMIVSDEYLNDRLRKSAKKLHIPLQEGCVHSSDVFYREDRNPYYKDLYDQYQCLAVEMESFALFHNARVLHKKAACLVTISDSFVTQKAVGAKEREQSFTKMMEIALEGVL